VAETVKHASLLWQRVHYNEGKSAASFFHQVAEWFPDMFRHFYIVKNHKIAKSSTTSKAREKIKSQI
jgi:hypothetical protein